MFFSSAVRPLQLARRVSLALPLQLRLVSTAPLRAPCSLICAFSRLSFPPLGSPGARPLQLSLHFSFPQLCSPCSLPCVFPQFSCPLFAVCHLVVPQLPAPLQLTSRQLRAHCSLPLVASSAAHPLLPQLRCPPLAACHFVVPEPRAPCCFLPPGVASAQLRAPCRLAMRVSSISCPSQLPTRVSSAARPCSLHCVFL